MSVKQSNPIFILFFGGLILFFSCSGYLSKNKKEPINMSTTNTSNLNSNCITEVKDPIQASKIQSEYFDPSKEPILTLDENNNPMKLISSPFIKRPPLKLHSVTGGINFTDDLGNASFKAGVEKRDSLEDNPLWKCLEVNNLNINLNGEFYITMPCDSLSTINDKKQKILSGHVEENVEIRTLLFKDNIKEPHSYKIETLKSEKIVNAKTITEESYYRFCLKGSIACRALVKLDLNYYVENLIINASTEDSEFPNEFVLVFIARDLHGNYAHDGNYFDGDEIDTSNTSLQYYKDLDADTMSHSSKHLSVVPFKICNPNYEDYRSIIDNADEIIRYNQTLLPVQAGN